MRDNLDTLNTKFKLEKDPKYAGGSIYRCNKCGSLAHSIEGFFPCQDNFLPMKVVCMECKNRWVLLIAPTDEDEKPVVH